MIRWALIAAAISGALAVIIGAVGAHALGSLSANDARAVFDTAWRYHALHTLALAIAALAPGTGVHRRACAAACGAWLAGLAIFSGSLYGLAVTGASWLLMPPSGRRCRSAARCGRRRASRPGDW